MNNETCTGSASADYERMLKYKTFAVALSYPDDHFFASFPDLLPEKDQCMAEYDRLFRTNQIWLYGTEHVAENEFQRANALADIMGFYRAFGMEPDRERPDSLPCEFEFMHYLVFKHLRAHSGDDGEHAEEKGSICLKAQRKFFTEHLYPASKRIAGLIKSRTENNFYREIVDEMLNFLESEAFFLRG